MKTFEEWIETVSYVGAGIEDKQDPDQGAHFLTGQILNLINKMKPLIEKMTNKNKGYELLGQISKALNDSMNLNTNTMVRTVKGQGPFGQ